MLMSRQRPTEKSLVLGIDFGSDSVRALVVSAHDGCERGAGTAAYRDWARGRFCDPVRQQFRQHPRDLLQAMTAAIRTAVAAAGPAAGRRIAALGVDTTGSSPLPVDQRCRPLALSSAFAEDPDAMMVLWKDHSAASEAARFTELCHSGRFRDYCRHVGGIYSCEWWWAKIAHIHAGNRRVADAAQTWIEHCDWIPAELSGVEDPALVIRSRCAAGHKACWHPTWRGLPDAAFLAELHPTLGQLRGRLYRETTTADQPAGCLTPRWATRLGLTPGITVAAGAFDAHLGAVGAGAGVHVLAKVIGTSTCDMLTVPARVLGKRTIRGICGQVDGSILPGLIGLEAGQSAFGDIFAWFRRLLSWSLTASHQPNARSNGLLPALETAARDIPIGSCGIIAVDWFNGRRTPDADANARGAIAGLQLGHDAPMVYRALIEAAACGSRAIVDRFVAEGVEVRSVIALGGIARRSPLVMQILADVLARPVAVVASDQCCALGSAIAAATAAKLYPTMAAAQRRMASPLAVTYRPDRRRVAAYNAVYTLYRQNGATHAAG